MDEAQADNPPALDAPGEAKEAARPRKPWVPLVGILVLIATFGEAAPVDLNRALFQAAEALKGRHFGKVTLSRGAKTVFILPGEDFAELGEEFAAGQNPLYLMRTLPEKLVLPDGRQAFGSWSGGILGVLGEQLEDMNDFAGAWAKGEPPPPSLSY
jgi:hypothetical protein